MGFKSDIKIAQSTRMQDIRGVAKTAGIPEDKIERYGNYKARSITAHQRLADVPDGKLILVTAITPAYTEEKTTTVGLADGPKDRKKLWLR